MTIRLRTVLNKLQMKVRSGMSGKYKHCARVTFGSNLSSLSLNQVSIWANLVEANMAWAHVV